jgi:hypothetical protein
MRVVRIAALVAVAVGAIGIASQPTELPVLPFPGPGHTIVLLADIDRSGNYRLQVLTPMPGSTQVALDEEHIPCELEVTLTEGGQPPSSRHIQTLYRSGQIGSMRLDVFNSDAHWALERGSISVQVSGTARCDAITARGGALSIQLEQTHTTESYLLHRLLYWGARGLVALGLLVLTFMEFRSALVQARRP